MNLIYYYPMKDGAPSNVGRNIFDTLYKKQHKLPFEELIIYTDSESKSILTKKFLDIKIFDFKEIYKINKEDIIHIPVSPFIFPNMKFLLHLFAKVKKNKIIINYHGDLRNEVKLKYKFEKKLEFTNFPTYLLIPSLLTSTNMVIVNSYLLENLIMKNYGVKSVKVIPNAIENFWFSEDQEYAVKDEDTFNIFYHGRLSSEKGIDILIKGFYGFLSKKKYAENIKLYIAGEGSYKESLQYLVHKLNIDEKIVFLGNTDKKMIKEYLKKVEVAIYPSIWDNFPLSILEALASANCPVFFSRRAGIYDFVNEEDFLYTFNPDIENVTDIFHYIFESKNERKRIESQRKFAERYTWNNIVEHYIQMYNDIVKS